MNRLLLGASVLCMLFTKAVQAQNVGIGTTTPQDRLDINGQVRSTGVRIVGQNILELGVGLTKQADNGKIGLNVFGETNTLSIVGGGVNAGGLDRRIKLWADGGTFFTGGANFQNTVSIGSSIVSSTAALQLNSTNQGLLINRLTTSQRRGITLPAEGLMVFDTDLGLFCYYDGVQWVFLQPTSSAATLPPTVISSSTTRCDLSDVFAVFYTNNDIRVYEKRLGTWRLYQTIPLPPGSPKGICVTNSFIAATSTTVDNGVNASGYLTVYTFNNSTQLFQQSYSEFANGLASGFGISMDAWDSVRQLTIGPGVIIPDTLLRIAVGATGNTTGAAYLYEKNGVAYSRFSIAAVPNGSGVSGNPEQFGYSVAVSGRYLLIGSPGWAPNSTQLRQGRAYLYRRPSPADGANTWSSSRTIGIASGNQLDQLGYSVALTSVWGAVGAPGYDMAQGGNQQGRGGVAVLKYNLLAQDYALDESLLGPLDSSDVAFGQSVAITDNGLLFVGASQADIPSDVVPGALIQNAGIVFQYNMAPRRTVPPLPLSVANPTLLRSFKAAVPYSNDFFGDACYARNGTLLIVKPILGFAPAAGQSASTQFYSY